MGIGWLVGWRNAADDVLQMLSCRSLAKVRMRIGERGWGLCGVMHWEFGLFFFVLGVTGCNARSMITINDDKNINECKLKKNDICNY